MSNQSQEAPEAQARFRRRFSLVWVIPVVAVAAAAWLAFENYRNRGPEVEINFRVAEGLQPGKTVIRFRDVEVGKVDEVDVSEDLSHVVVKARFNPLMGKHLVEDTRFWIVRPRVGAGGISGLSTLISGSYIGMDVGSSGARRVSSFKGLETPPINMAGERGLTLVLEAATLAGISEGAPVFYRDMNVGAVLRFKLDKDDTSKVLVHVLVRKKHASLVNSQTRFWNASGVDVGFGLDGVAINVSSLQSLLVGGVSFETVGAVGKPAEAQDHFHLYASRKAAVSAVKQWGGLRVVLDAPELGSIQVGDPVYYREEVVGNVVDHSLHEDARSVGIMVEIARKYSRLVRTNSVFWNASGIEAGIGFSGVKIHTESLEALMRGGVAFATPNALGARAAKGSVFTLHPKGDGDWRKWSPRIWLGSGSDPAAGKKTVAAKAERVSALSKSGRSESYGGRLRGRGMK